MDFPSALKADGYRPLVVTFIPGALAALPWVHLLHSQWYGLTIYRIDYQVVYFFGFFCFAIVIGILLEEFGSMVEVLIWDKRLAAEKEFPDFHEVWNTFLGLTYDREPIGLRYLRTILLGMKFTTSMMLAIPVALVGLLICALATQWPSWLVLAGLAVIGLAGSLMFCGLSYLSCRLLARTRAILVKARSAS